MTVSLRAVTQTRYTPEAHEALKALAADMRASQNEVANHAVLVLAALVPPDPRSPLRAQLEALLPRPAVPDEYRDDPPGVGVNDPVTLRDALRLVVAERDHLRAQLELVDAALRA